MEYVITVEYSSGAKEKLIFHRLDWALDVAKNIENRGDKAIVSLEDDSDVYQRAEFQS